MPLSSDLAQLNPNWMKEEILGSRIGEFELRFNLHIKKQQT